MPKVKVYNMQGKKVGEETLNPDIFNVEINPDVIHRARVAQLSKRRRPIAKVLGRGEVRGGGAKPWRQKGTGRARAGSIRSPLWRGGGVVFGPTPKRTFVKGINKKEKRKALFMSLTDKINKKCLILVDKLKLSNIKTKKILEILNRLPIKGKSTLIILPKPDRIVQKSTDNLVNVKTLLANSLNVIDILKYDCLLMPIESLKVIEKTYLK